MGAGLQSLVRIQTRTHADLTGILASGPVWPAHLSDFAPAGRGGNSSWCSIRG